MVKHQLEDLAAKKLLGVGKNLHDLRKCNFLKLGTNLEIKVLGVMHMSRPLFFYLGLPKSVSKLAFLNMCGFPFNLSVELIKLSEEQELRSLEEAGVNRVFVRRTS